jgi:hypothetical protein
MLFIGRCRATADVYNRVSALDKLWHEVSTHMTVSSNDDDPSHGFLLRLSTSIVQIPLTRTARYSERSSETIL